MRASGLDETAYAKKMGTLIETMSNKDDPKLLLDGMKEWGRHLESPRGGERSAGENGEPVPVQLVHYVSRPERDKPTDN